MKRKMERIIIWVFVLSLVCLLFHYLDYNKKAGNLISYSEAVSYTHLSSCTAKKTEMLYINAWREDTNFRK